MFARATCALSVSQEYLGFECGHPVFTQDFTSLALLWILLGHLAVAYGAITLCGAAFQQPRLGLMNPKCSPNPKEQAPWFGLLRFRSPLLAQSLAISVPRATKMFQFTRLASLAPDPVLYPRR